MTTPSLSIYSADERGLLSDSANAVLVAYLDTLGTGAGTYNMAAAAGKYFTKPAAGLVYIIDTVKIVISTAAVTSATNFGGIAALATGCKFDVRSGTPAVVTRDLTGGVLLKSNAQLASLGHFDALNFTASSIVTIEVRNPRSPIRLTGDYGDALYFETQDNLAGLSSMYVVAMGTIFKN